MIAIISGTNRKGSNTLKMAKIVEAYLEKNDTTVSLIDLSTLPKGIFEPESYDTQPKEIEPLQTKILAAKGIITVVPEYNGSFPGALKYFIDLLKFPESLNGKPCAFVGVAAGMAGAARSVNHLQAIYQYRNAFLFNQFVLFPRVNDKLSVDGTEVDDPFLKGLLEKMLKDFPKFCSRF